jgi:DNA-directed RNA polymerase I, II, and III subunit RPABC4
MSREQYQPPATGAGQTDFSGGASSGTTGAVNTGFQASGSGFEDTARPVHYLCGDCDNKVTLKKGDPIRCKECGYRVLYKERTNR